MWTWRAVERKLDFSESCNQLQWFPRSQKPQKPLYIIDKKNEKFMDEKSMPVQSVLVLEYKISYFNFSGSLGQLI